MIELTKNNRGRLCKIKENGKDVNMTITCKIPFGLEYYNKNKIVNLSLVDTNNEQYNSIQEFITTEKKIINLIPESIKKTRNFVSSIKSLDENIGQKIIRTYISKKKNEQFVLNPKYVKTKCAINVQIRFDSVWTTLSSYGVLVNILDIKSD